jgi:hypothetical protein
MFIDSKCHTNDIESGRLRAMNPRQAKECNYGYYDWRNSGGNSCQILFYFSDHVLPLPDRPNFFLVASVFE